MESVPATFRNGQVELAETVNWPEGTNLEVVPRTPSSTPLEAQHLSWPAQFFDQLRQEWGDTPFARPVQGELEDREEW